MTIANTSAGSNEAAIYGYLVNTEGFTPAGAAGALGNAQVETGSTPFDPTAFNPNEQAIGEFQWELDRRTRLQAYAAAHGGKETDLAMQLGFMAQELSGGFSNVLSYMRTATDPKAAAAYWDQNFEHSAGTTRTARVNNATSIYDQITTGHLTATSGGSDTPPPFVPNTLKPPLSTQQRSAIINWLVSQGDTRSSLIHDNDTVLWAAYVARYDSYKLRKSAITGPQIPGLDLLGGVKTLVLKSVFTVAGLAMIVLGAGAAAKGSAK